MRQDRAEHTSQPKLARFVYMLCCAANAPYIMQTNFTADQLRDPQIAEANAILQTCVHSGFCTNTCPTYVLTRDENKSPRGYRSHPRDARKRRCARSENRRAPRQLPFVPVLHDDLRGEGGLRPSDRPRAGLYPGQFPPLADRAHVTCISRARAAASARVRRGYLARAAGAPIAAFDAAAVANDLELFRRGLRQISLRRRCFRRKAQCGSAWRSSPAARSRR